jgi:hypothetical protein
MRTTDQDRDMTNRKPYRTAEQKAVARETAKKINGTWVSNAPVSYHYHVKNGKGSLALKT